MEWKCTALISNHIRRVTNNLSAFDIHTLYEIGRGSEISENDKIMGIDYFDCDPAFIVWE